MAEDKIFKYRGRQYSMDTAGVLRLIQRALTDSDARFSRGDKSQLSAALEPLIFKVVAAEKQMIDGQPAGEDGVERQKDQYTQRYTDVVLFDRAVHQNDVTTLLDRLRQPGEFPLSDILPGDNRGAIPVTVQGGIMVIFDSSEVVRLRAFLKGDVLGLDGSGTA